MKTASTKLFKLSTLDGCACATMIGLGETFFPALLLALTGNSINAGLVITLPLFIASILQILLFNTRRFFSTHRNFVCTFATLQGLALVTLSIAVFAGKTSTVFIFSAATLYWAFGQSTAPVWNSWLSDLVPEAKRLNFFSRREKWCQIATTLALISGGLVLQSFATHTHKAFAFLFLTAGLFRFLSSYLLFKHPDSVPSDSSPTRHTSGSNGFADFFRWAWAYKHIFAFLFLIKTAVYYSASYFNPYMLKELSMSYWVYTLLMTVALTSRVFIMHFTERIAKKIGIKYLLLFSTIALGVSPSLWPLSHHPLFLAGLQMLSGCAWACFDFSVLIYFMNSMEHSTRSKLLVGVNFFYSLAALTGSTLGAFALKELGESLESYHRIFESSSYMRLSCLLLVPAFFKHKVKITHIATRIISLRPASGAMIKPIIFKRNKH